MCGIGLIVSRVTIGGYAFSSKSASSEASSQQVIEGSYPRIEDLCGALKRRGPDHTGGAILHVEPLNQHLELWGASPLDSAVNGVSKEVQRSTFGTSCKEDGADFQRIASVEPCDAALPPVSDVGSGARLDFAGTTLQLRGEHPVRQPLVDSGENLLVYNGEIFDGLVVQGTENDGEVLMATFRGCCGCNCHSSHLLSGCPCTDAESHRSVPEVLSKLRGPWALIYWQAVSKTLWFGRDAIGRRSLLIHPPSANDPRLVLTSVAPDVREDKAGSFEYWEDLACGIYSVAFSALDEGVTRAGTGGYFTVPDTSMEEGTAREPTKIIISGWARQHSWEDPRLRALLAWNRQYVTPNEIKTLETFKCDQLCNSDYRDVNFLAFKEGQEGHNVSLEKIACENESSRDCELNDSNWQEVRRALKHKAPVEQVLTVLREAVRRRTIDIRQHWISD